ncbi:GNAT family N-acetyltransferase [Vagococcus elongatus]|uniref:GNAT family N-acetyltransferase n=1 Tax=Vagococcus elongatus TaxID=180344 RepID=A0A430B604_9ENTE|nr:GNAT family N-acetyltransferase [Vagococcus elongatus]RSU15724.1 GNAT family N-acetyltransferase [Vagococcus elongatus]
MEIFFRKMNTVEEVNDFWQKKRHYEREDIFPNLEEKDDELQEIIAWFQSEEYYEIIMDLHQHAQAGGQTLSFVFMFDEQNNYLGFTMYKIYTEEDGKAFILDFCIEKDYRNKGIGSIVVRELEKFLKREGASYIALNTSNKKNLNFWEKNGFSKFATDEFGKMVYTKKILIDGN